MFELYLPHDTKIWKCLKCTNYIPNIEQINNGKVLFPVRNYFSQQRRKMFYLLGVIEDFLKITSDFLPSLLICSLAVPSLWLSLRLFSGCCCKNVDVNLCVIIIVSCLGTSPIMSHFLEFRSRLKSRNEVCSVLFFIKKFIVLYSPGMLATSISGRLLPF